jgi:molecular chaperone GrpE
MALPKKEQRIPIRRPGDDRVRAGDAVPEPGDAEAERPVSAQPTPVQAASVDQVESRAQPTSGEDDTGVDWRDAALRLKAEMENYRKRQKRWAEDEVKREKADLLLKFLEVIDNLEYALQHIDRRDPAHQGVQLAYDALLNLLLREGVERIFAKGQPFDPHYHDAVAVVPAERGRADELRVVEVTSPGYRFADRVLRPAKVVVAKPGA